MSDTAERQPTPTGALLEALGASAAPDDWREQFAETFSKTRSLTRACEVAGIHRRTLGRLLEQDDEFRDVVTAIRERITDDLEAVAIERAMGTSDRLLEFLLKGRRRDVYGDKRDVTMTHRVLQFGRDEAQESDEEVLEAQIVEEDE